MALDFWYNEAEKKERDKKWKQDFKNIGEDVYSFLHNKIQLKYGADLSGIAYDIKEQVRKGIYSHKAMPEDIEKLLYESEVPRWYIESMKKIRYLFPKTQLIAALKREICNIK